MRMEIIELVMVHPKRDKLKRFAMSLPRINDGNWKITTLQPNCFSQAPKKSLTSDGCSGWRLKTHMYTA